MKPLRNNTAIKTRKENGRRDKILSLELTLEKEQELVESAIDDDCGSGWEEEPENGPLEFVIEKRELNPTSHNSESRAAISRPRIASESTSSTVEQGPPITVDLTISNPSQVRKAMMEREIDEVSRRSLLNDRWAGRAMFRSSVLDVDEHLQFHDWKLW